jgi:hypothetical protein
MPYRFTEGLTFIVASAIPALMITAAGMGIASTTADVNPEERIETRVLGSGYEPVFDAEPQKVYVVCTTRAGLTTCNAFDLGAAAIASN